MQGTTVSSIFSSGNSDRSPVSLQKRKLELVFSEDIPNVWYDDNPIATMLWASFSVTLPEGERQFIRSVRHFESQVNDPELKARIREFAFQEGQHAKQHSLLNNFLRARGYPVDKVLQDLEKLIEHERALSPKAQLALTVTAEHFTAIIADYFLSKHPEELDKMHPELAQLWAWHAIEEAEHKSVAFDVYMTIFGDRAYLNRLMALQTWYISWQMTRHMALFAKSTGDLFKPASLVKGLWYFARPGSIIWSSLPDYLSFYRPGFHPWQNDNRLALNRARRRYLDET